MLARPASAHVGTSAVFAQGKAGPYPIYVTVTPPAVVPGEAQVSVICDAAGVETVSAQANVLGGDASRYMPEGQRLVAGPAGSHEFHGVVWVMTQGSWQVRVTVSDESNDADDMKDIVRARVIPILKQKIPKFIEELKPSDFMD